ncbi:phosphate ABC transporter permease PstA [Streptomyces lunaelactis]|uniref:phosphate ABC transporter permease PstA n=1 Tax=Streptomyces lunaelactis TaxID=1535768 RepID=UPI0015844C2E|nr:phosphate ABC transporter permease PstA [Streptomyces lunaelactis]NUK32815.1 phosphate ABC transporter permease PstA [Streptomyces lunaelactis]NUK44345.1 phosphate ABC transporter permease PstA [Streptomyces lunaelactis]NUK95802.1 phosphate ABC transporter permease PstA [Streptomyces lunaelactis]NUL29719.1 phosphate ABC transporter permease PstA [Streptomyces lunaelactis]
MTDLLKERPAQTVRPATEVRDESPEVRRNTSSVHGSDLLALAGAAVGSLALTALLFTWIAPFDSILGFVVVTYVFFLGIYAVLVSFDEKSVAVRDKVAAVLWQSLATLLLAALVMVVVYTLWRGKSSLVHLNFFTEAMSRTGPLQPLTEGGVLHAIVGTLEQIAISLAITVPLGLACAVFLNEVPGRYARFVRTIVEAMTALPSIVAGLFIYATVILMLGFDKSGFVAALALSVMMLPIIIRAADVVIRLVPGSLREASYALGASQWRTVWTVVLPTARSGLTTAVILGTARGIGETSPVLLTSGFTPDLNLNPLTGPQVSLPLATFQLVSSPQPNMIARGFGSAALLMALVLLLFIVARVVGGRGPGELTRNQRHRRVQASRRDAQRMSKRAALRPQAALASGESPYTAPSAVPYAAPDVAPDPGSRPEPGTASGAPGRPSD